MISLIRKQLGLGSKRSYTHVQELSPLVKCHEEKNLKTKADPTVAMRELQPSTYHILLN